MENTFRMLRMLTSKRAAYKAIAAGDAARDKREWERARAEYREALRLAPELAPIWVQYGHALKESGLLGEAEIAYRRSIELNGTEADTHLQLGHVLKMQGRMSEGVDAYFKALELDGKLAHAHRELLSLGYSNMSIRRRLRRSDRHVATKEPRVILILAQSISKLPPELRAIAELTSIEKELVAAKVEYDAGTSSWKALPGSSDPLFRRGDVLVSLGEVSLGFLRLIRHTIREFDVTYCPVVAADVALFDTYTPISKAALADRWLLLQQIEHASMVITPYAATNRLLPKIHKWKDGVRPPLLHVNFNTLPSLQQSSSDEDLSFFNKIQHPYVFVDLRELTPADAASLTGACAGAISTAAPNVSLCLLGEFVPPDVSAEVSHIAIARASDTAVAKLVENAECVVIPRSSRGWATMALTTLSKRSLPVLSADPFLAETGAGVGEVCATNSAQEIALKLSRVLKDRDYAQNRREMISTRFALRDAVSVVRDLQTAVTAANSALDTGSLRLPDTGYSTLRVRIPYAFSNTPRSFRGLPFAAGNQLLANGPWEDRIDDTPQFLKNGVSELAFICSPEIDELVELKILVQIAADASVKVTSSQASSTEECEAKGSGLHWLTLLATPDYARGVVSLGFDCKLAGGSCALLLLYADAKGQLEVNRRFLEALQAAITTDNLH